MLFDLFTGKSHHELIRHLPEGQRAMSRGDGIMTARRNRNVMFLALAFVLSVLAGGCSNVPTAELKVFRESVVTANTAATPILDEVSANERRIKQAVVDGEKGEPSFSPDDARYFSDIGDAPGTAMIRRAHTILDRFSDILLGLATGSNVDSDVSGVESLVKESTGLLATVTSIVPAAGTAAAAIQGAFTVAKPGLTFIAHQLSHREARRVIQMAVDKKVVGELTKALVDASPAMFNLLVQDAFNASTDENSTAEVRRIAQKAYIERTRKVRLLMANYVVLVQRMNSAWDEAATASAEKTTISITVLNERIGELRVAAVATRKAYVDLHTASTK
jgi:hypothetical protein